MPVHAGEARDRQRRRRGGGAGSTRSCPGVHWLQAGRSQAPCARPRTRDGVPVVVRHEERLHPAVHAGPHVRAEGAGQAQQRRGLGLRERGDARVLLAGVVVWGWEQRWGWVEHAWVESAGKQTGWGSRCSSPANREARKPSLQLPCPPPSAAAPFSLTPQSTPQLRLGSTPRPFLRRHSSPRSTRSRPRTFSMGTSCEWVGGKESRHAWVAGRQQAAACAPYMCRTGLLLAAASDARQPRSPPSQPALPGTSIAAPRHTTARTLMAERCSTASTASRGRPQASSRAPRAGASHSRRSRRSPISLDTSSRPCSPKFWRAAGRCGEARAGDARRSPGGRCRPCAAAQHSAARPQASNCNANCSSGGNSSRPAPAAQRGPTHPQQAQLAGGVAAQPRRLHGHHREGRRVVAAGQRLLVQLQVGFRGARRRAGWVGRRWRATRHIGSAVHAVAAVAAGAGLQQRRACMM